MKTDRELIELAAEAAGIAIEWDGDLPIPFGSDAVWNPLTDDGDNRRLQIKLKIPLQFPDWQDIARTWGPEGDSTEYIEAAVNHNGDLAAAARLAVVRAAAAMAEESPA